MGKCKFKHNLIEIPTSCWMINKNHDCDSPMPMIHRHSGTHKQITDSAIKYYLINIQPIVKDGCFICVFPYHLVNPMKFADLY